MPKLSAVIAHKALARLLSLDVAPLSETSTATSEDGVCVCVKFSQVAKPAPDERPTPFLPNAVQKVILLALDGKAMRSTKLAGIVGDRARLFRKPGGIQELRDHGLVAHHPRLGYYRPDRLPKELQG